MYRRFQNERTVRAEFAWDMGLKDVWRRKDFLPILKKINTLEDICNQEHFPYRDEDFDLFYQEVKND